MRAKVEPEVRKALQADFDAKLKVRVEADAKARAKLAEVADKKLPEGPPGGGRQQLTRPRRVHRGLRILSAAGGAPAGLLWCWRDAAERVGKLCAVGPLPFQVA
jgi:hypothetical protein